jgi:D-sedoheptulose 7-phosphate isomerase
MNEFIREEIASHIALAQEVLTELEPAISEACNMAADSIQSGHKILLFGNGGSAADAQHIATELSGRFRRERRGLPAIALTTDSSALTAISNDYGFEQVFARQVEALAQPGDLCIGISTSGNSPNVLAAMQKAAEIGCQRLGMTGASGGKLKEQSDLCLCIPSGNTARIQEMHILIGHLICEAVERKSV